VWSEVLNASTYVSVTLCNHSAGPLGAVFMDRYSIRKERYCRAADPQ